MTLREVVCFKSTLPEDIFETEDGEGFVQPPGKSAADAVALIFQELGFEVYHGPEPESDFVWGMGLSKAGRNFGVGLNLVDDYYLTFSNPSLVDKLFGRRPAIYIKLLHDFATALGQDARFSGARWFPLRDPCDGPGHPTPT